MNRHLIVLRKSVWVLLLASVLACGEEPAPAPKPKTVSQKIAVQPPKPALATTVAPTPPVAAVEAATSETAPQPAATPVVPPASPALTVETPKVEKAGPAQVSSAPAAPKIQPGAAAALESAQMNPATAEVGATAALAPPAPPAAAEASELIKASQQIATSYDPEGRFDPFEPLFKEQSSQQTTSAKDKRTKRTAQTPLERVALAQLKVTAIIRAASGNRALVEDATGKGYVVQIGTYMGLNSGQVIRIDNDRIVVEEEIESVMGELTVQNNELKLQKPAGEL